MWLSYHVTNDNSEVDMSDSQCNAAAWVIKKSLNLHGRLQGRSKTRRDEEVQEISAPGPHCIGRIEDTVASWCIDTLHS